ncbi:MAG TPA: 4Fe-4S dicluster domain-containing protein [Methanomicrobia archaeon]|nr:4Fe-4S dicluster domain-containing protein [Methanomicrobia archaeon]HEX59828.1 4Fe-4S dicluster domain-containing protein [Methanomicrobia archaeon]
MKEMTLHVDHAFREKIVSELGAERLLRCFQCSTCTVNCPISEFVDWNPRLVVEKCLLGLRDVLNEEGLWLCTSCQNCYEHCPQDVRFSEVILALRRLATEEIKAGRLKVGSTKPVFDECFLEMIAKYGRQYEAGLIRMFAKRSGLGFKLLLSFKGLGIRLLKKGKVALRPKKIKHIEEIRDIFRKFGGDRGEIGGYK